MDKAKGKTAKVSAKVRLIFKSKVYEIGDLIDLSSDELKAIDKADLMPYVAPKKTK